MKKVVDQLLKAFDGLIFMWYGSSDNLPVGWVLCDGTQGTPDLRDQFILGAGGSESPGGTGGALEHEHEFSSDGHRHDLLSGTEVLPGGGRFATTTYAYLHGHTDFVNSRPPYRGVFFIMKLP